MKYSEVSELKEKIMLSLSKAVNEMLDQLQYNELAQAARGEKNVNLQLGHFDAKLTMDLPKHYGSNGEGFHIICNPVVTINKDAYRNEDLIGSRELLVKKMKNK